MRQPEDRTDRPKRGGARACVVAVLACVPSLLAGCGSGGDAAKPPSPGWDGGGEGDAAEDAGCSPKTCAMIGAQCGTAPDGCGGALACGDCPSGQTCGGGGPNECGTSACVPRTCVQLGASCGAVSDGCSQVLDCGECEAPESCGGGGVPNACGLTCDGSTKKCSGTCVDLSDPAFGCEIPLDPSDPCAPCPSGPNGMAACEAGVCSVVCSAGWGDCDASSATGCETSLETVANCGACGVACPSSGGTPVCQDAKCDVIIPTWSYEHWRVDQPQGGCGEWGKITEVQFRVAGAWVTNGATGYASGTAGGKAVVAIAHTGDSSSYGRAWMAFDGTGDPWQSYAGGTYYWTGSESLRLQVAQPIVAQAVKVGGFWGSTKCVRLSGSHDGTAWTVLGTGCNTDCNSVVTFAP